jgi:hypothetical protein
MNAAFEEHARLDHAFWLAYHDQQTGRKQDIMNDQPIIYWQDDPNDPAISLNSAYRPPDICVIQLYGHSIALTRDQARSLGYALIARATVTPEDDASTDDRMPRIITDALDREYRSGQ